MTSNSIFVDRHGKEVLADDLAGALHFELCPGGYDGSMILFSDIGDREATIHYIDIRAGFPGAPATLLESYDPCDIATALRNFFRLKQMDRPLYYHGGMCFKVDSLEDLTAELVEALFPEDEDDDDDDYNERSRVDLEGALQWHP